MADENGNGRVTLAVLSTKIDAVLESQKQLEAWYRSDHDRLTGLERTALENRKDIDELSCKVERIDTREKWWAGLNSMATAIAIGLWASMRQP